MDILMYAGLFVVSLIVLLKASDWFIDSAEEIGLSLGISPFIIGVTIVAFGTSLPELATSVAAVLNGDSKLVINNVVGSNITNIALVLGLVALTVKMIRLEYNIWHIDMPFLWGSAFLLWLTTKDQNFTIPEACLFIAGIIIFLTYSFKSDNGDDEEEKPKASPKSYLLLVVGGILVWLGADYTIFAIMEISKLAGIDSGIISLSLVSLGTSLPEVIVSITAARKGKTGMAVGNVLGSNIFNTYVVMGIARLFGPLEIPTYTLTFSLPLMLVMTILFGIVSSNKKISLWEGVLLLMFYVYFMMEVIMRGMASVPVTPAGG